MPKFSQIWQLAILFKDNFFIEIFLNKFPFYSKHILDNDAAKLQVKLINLAVKSYIMTSIVTISLHIVALSTLHNFRAIL
jgi:type III secretory pathway component EscT